MFSAGAGRWPWPWLFNLVIMKRRRVNLGILGLFCALAVLLAACAPAGPPEIRIEEVEGWNSPVLVGVVSVFMKIVNSGQGRDVLVGAGLDLPEAPGVIVELHDTVNNRMVKAKMIPAPAAGTTELRPGDKHIMIFKLPSELTAAGAVLPLRLEFKQSGSMVVPVPVVDAPAVSR